MRYLVMLAAVMLCAVGLSAAQEPSGVYVTVQDNTALRAGPGTGWEMLAVLPFGTTYRATGRTLDGDWIQVAYEGDLVDGARGEFTRDGVTYGWVAYWLLVWSGNILNLPIDGENFVTTARAAGPTIIVGPDTYIYRDEVDPSTQIFGLLDHYVLVETTGRIGSSASGDFWVQFKYNNQYYWTATWALGNRFGYESLPDGSYLYPYGRLLDQTRRDYNQARSVYNDIAGRWNALNSGQPTTCNEIPDDIASRGAGFRTFDLTLQPLFGPMAEALDNAETAVNAALAKFRAICSDLDTRPPVTPQTVGEALVDVAEASRNLNTVQLLLRPFERRDPLLGNGNG